MVELVWKLRVAVLWIFFAVTEATGLVLLIYQPGVIRDIVRGEVAGVPGTSGDPGTTQAQIYTALSVVVPLAMAFATFLLSDRANRWASGVLGSMLAFTSFFILVQSFGDPSVFILAVLFVVSLLVLWHVRKWPKTSRVTSDTPEGHAVGAGR